MKNVMNGYKRYIIGNGILNLDKIGFSSYMESDMFKQILAESMGSLLDTSGLQDQFTASLQQNLQGIMARYLESYSQQLTQKLGEALQEKLTAAIQAQIGTVMQQLMRQLTAQFSQQLQTSIQKNISKLSSQVEDALQIDAAVFQNAVQLNMSTDDLVDLVKLNLQSGSTTYNSVLGSLGYSDYASPGSIWIYPNSFEAKNRIVENLNAYNASMREQGQDDKVIVFSDTVGTLMSAVTKIVGMVSNVLVAFVAISLVVSSIMIGVITYISVLERRKEIGILRAIGASKHNVSQVFNAETFIIGLCSGVIGVGLCLLLLIPRQHAHPFHCRYQQRHCRAAAQGRIDPDRTGHPAYHPRRPDPRPQRSQVQPLLPHCAPNKSVLAGRCPRVGCRPVLGMEFCIPARVVLE